MKKIILLNVLLLLISAVYTQNLYKVSKSTIEFTSDAALEVIQAKSNALKGLLNTETNFYAFRVEIPSFHGFNSALQETHFNETYMESSVFPYTLFDGKILDEVNLSINGNYKVQGKGKFTCHGVSFEKTIETNVEVKDDKILINSSFNVLLKDHNIKIPTVVNMKVAEEIIVSLSIEMVPKD